MRKLILFFLILTVSSFACADNTQRIYLSGTDAEHTKTWSFFCSDGQNSGKWGKIEVPSCWEQQGYGAYTYGRYYKTKGAKPSRETGRYRTNFCVPKANAEKVYRLVFEASMTDTQVWIDGKLVNTLLCDGENTGRSIHQGGFMEFSYDITNFVTPGKKQQIEVLVKKESANKSVNSAERFADWWLFGGIYRPVYIDILPKSHFEHINIDARANGEIYTDIKATSSDAITLSIDGKDIPYDNTKGCYVYPNPKTWDPEHPNLYTATFTLGGNDATADKTGKNSNASERHSVTRKIGFRTIEFRPHDGIYLNGSRLVVKGTNRHCFHPETGRATSKAMSIMDAKILKGMNMNAVRCHYPSDRHFLDVCDSIGLLYLDEFPGWQTHYDDSTALRLLPEFVMRDQWRTCVLFWDNGNEGGWNTIVDPLFAKMDIQHRKVIHPWANFEGMDTNHYPAYQTGTYRLQNGQNVFMPTEFLHGKYDKGQGSALEDMWNHWMASPLFAGGFIWSYLDEAVRRTDLPTGKSKGRKFGQKGFSIKDCILDSDGGNAPDGCMDPYRQPEASVATIREIWSPVYIDRLTAPDVEYGNSGEWKVLVANHYCFSSLRECSMKYRLMQASASGMTEMAEGDAVLPAIEPGESEYARIKMDDNFSKCDVIELIAFDKKGEEICRWSTPNSHKPQQEDFCKVGKSIPVEVSFTENGELSLSCNGMTERKITGPLPVGMMADCYKHVQRTEADGTIVNTFWYKGGIDSIVWKQTPKGELLMDALMLNDERGHGYQGKFLTDECKYQVGISFYYPEQGVDSVRWLGRGPHRVWRNRLKGQQYGVWSLAYNNTVTGQYGSSVPPVYPEFKGYRDDVRWMDFFTKESDGIVMRISTEQPKLYYRLFTPEEAVDQTPGEMGGLQEGRAPKSEKTMVAFPEGDLSFLLSIPPMQSYKPLDQLGPHSQPDDIRIKLGDDGLHIRLKFEFYK